VSGGVITGNLVAAMAAIETTLASVPSVSGADLDTLAALQAQIATAQGYAQQVLEYYDTALAASGAPANFASGTAPATMIANVQALLANTSAITYAFDCSAKLGRLAKNVAAIITG